MTRNRRYAVAVVCAALVLATDQVTKVWASRALVDDTIDLIWTLRLKLVHNSGSAFGLGAGYGQLLGVIVLVVIVGLCFYVKKVDRSVSQALLGLIIGGALGNLIDRVARAESGVFSGSVVDFIDLQWWPVFNVADMAVVVGSIGLATYSARYDLTSDSESNPTEGAVSVTGPG